MFWNRKSTKIPEHQEVITVPISASILLGPANFQALSTIPVNDLSFRIRGLNSPNANLLEMVAGESQATLIIEVFSSSTDLLGGWLGDMVILLKRPVVSN
jgi:hypothetical protein